MSRLVEKARRKGTGKISAFFLTRAVNSGLIKKKKDTKALEAAMEVFVPEEIRKDKKKLKKIKNEVMYNRIVYLISPEEYFLYEFKGRSDADKRTFIGEFERRHLCRDVNGEDGWDVFKDKYRTYQIFREYYRREIILVKDPADHDVFLDFWNRHDRFIIKPGSQCRGIGVEVIDTAGKDPEAFFAGLAASGEVVMEELIVESESLASFHPQSVNTVRLATFYDGEKVTPLFSVFRMGRGSAVVDNGGSGGCFSTVDITTGELITPAVSEDGHRFTAHPNTGKQIVGFVIPRWQELLDLAQKFARVVDQPFISWDLALTDAGWVIVEGNGSGQFLQQMSSIKGCRAEVEPYFKAALKTKKIY